jgi:hypothetical protein
MRGWDFGENQGRDSKVGVYDSSLNTSKRFLTVVQGLQLPYRLHPDNSGYRREPSNMDETYTTDRDRIFGLRFWKSNKNTSAYRIYDTWIGEGFSPREVRAILGLTTNDKKTIRGTYVDAKMEAAGFYVPVEDEE